MKFSYYELRMNDDEYKFLEDYAQYFGKTVKGAIEMLAINSVRRMMYIEEKDPLYQKHRITKEDNDCAMRSK